MSTVAAAHPVTSPRMRVITDSGRWWRVVGGSVDLRLVPADRRSAHRPLVRVDDGGIVIGVDPTAVPTGWELVAVRGRGATLVERSSVDTPSDPEVAAWLHLLACRLTVAGPTPPPAHDLIVPGARSIRLAEPIVASTPVLAHVRNGEALLYGHGSARLNAGATTLLPKGAWVVPAPTGPADVDVVGLPDRGSRRWRSAIDTFHRVALTAIVAELARRDDDRRQRAAARIDYARDLVEGAASTIVNVLAHRQPTLALGRSGDELALAAVRAVGDHEGFSVTGAPPGHGSTDPTEAVLRASRVPWRDVRLEGFWWKRLGAPLITTVAETGSPVAVLPRARGGALLVDPATDTEAVLDETAAEALTPHAKQVYAPIPRTADTAREVFGFALRGARRDLTLLLLAGLTVGVLGLATPIVTGRLVGGSVGRTSLGSLIVVVVIAAIATGLFATVRNLAAVRLQGRLQARLEPAMWDRLLGLDVSFYARYTVGELVQRTNSIAYIRQSLSDATVNTVLGAFFSAFSLAALVLVDPRLAAATLGVVAVLAATLTMLGRRQQRHDRERFDLFGQVYGMLYPLLVGIDKIQVAGRESHAYAHWSSVYARQWVRDLRSLRYQALAASVSSCAQPAFLLVLIATVGYVHRGVATGTFLIGVMAISQLVLAIGQLNHVVVGVFAVAPIFDRLRPILTAPAECSPTASHPGRLAGTVELQRVSFSYPGTTKRILHDVSLRIAPGEFVAIVGPSGAGKSTIIRLLLGFEDPLDGHVLFDGRDLVGLDRAEVRRQLGVVLQDSRAVQGTVLDNLSGTVPGATVDDAWAAAELAGIASDIRDLPMGMDTPITPDAPLFSGGQLQRLILARALARRPRILLLDEATSALDNRTQQLVADRLAHLDATRIVVAHRLSTVRDADRICVLDEARIAETGTYRELMALGGTFARLVERQEL